jgi:hypothetical protein
MIKLRYRIAVQTYIWAIVPMPLWIWAFLAFTLK